MLRRSPLRITSSTPSGTVRTTGSAPVGATALTPPGPRAAGDPLDEILLGPELVPDHGLADRLAGARGDPQRRRVAGEGAAGLDLALRVGLPVVQREGQRQRPGVRRQGDPQPGRRIGAAQHVTVEALGGHAIAENRRTLHQGRLADGRGGRPGRGRGRSCPSPGALAGFFAVAREVWASADAAAASASRMMTNARRTRIRDTEQAYRLTGWQRRARRPL